MKKYEILLEEYIRMEDFDNFNKEYYNKIPEEVRESIENEYKKWLDNHNARVCGLSKEDRMKFYDGQNEYLKDKHEKTLERQGLSRHPKHLEYLNNENKMGLLEDYLNGNNYPKDIVDNIKLNVDIWDDSIAIFHLRRGIKAKELGKLDKETLNIAILMMGIMKTMYRTLGYYVEDYMLFREVHRSLTDPFNVHGVVVGDDISIEQYKSSNIKVVKEKDTIRELSYTEEDIVARWPKSKDGRRKVEIGYKELVGVLCAENAQALRNNPELKAVARKTGPKSGKYLFTLDAVLRAYGIK